MSSSWTREARRRAQASPVAALAALFAVCAGVSLYATVLGGSVPLVQGGGVADPTLDRVHDAASDGGVTAPDRLAAATTRGPEGYRLNVSLAVANERWTAGPAAPRSATDRASRLVSVRLAPGRVEPGRLSVVVWS